jgi:hypothetical protein
MKMQLECEFSIVVTKVFGKFSFFFLVYIWRKKKLKNEKKIANFFETNKLKAIARRDFFFFFFFKNKKNLESNAYAEVHGLR